RREWQAIRADLDQLANYYNLTPRWSSDGIGTGDTGYNNNNNNNNYQLSDYQMRQLIDRLNTRSATFSRNLRMDLNRRSYNNRYSVDEVRRQLSDFEQALVQLRNRVNSRQSSASDVRTLLERAA